MKSSPLVDPSLAREVHSNFTVWDAPSNSAEADLLAVANHDFSQLSLPILVACHDQEQFEEFTFREGLMCSQIRRFRAGKNDTEDYPRGKILLLLPGWFEPRKAAMPDTPVVKKQSKCAQLAGAAVK